MSVGRLRDPAVLAEFRHELIVAKSRDGQAASSFTVFRRRVETSLTRSGELQDGYRVAELTGLNTYEGPPEGMRLIVRAWLLILYDSQDLADAEPAPMLHRVPARLTRRHHVRIVQSRP
ncbi:hypothetical protein ACWC09_20160 [Streptomyces sp. NPDC001617]